LVSFIFIGTALAIPQHFENEPWWSFEEFVGQD
jgi:hypothetical protein